MPQKIYLPKLGMWADDIVALVNSDGSHLGAFGTNPPLENRAGGSVWLETLGIWSGKVLAAVNPDGTPLALTSDGSAVIVDDTPPAEPLTDGQLWWDSSTGSLYVWYVDDDDSSQWVQIVSGGSSLPIVSDTAPLPPLITGQLWWDSTTGNLYTWYVDDDDSSQWVQINTSSSGSSAQSWPDRASFVLDVDGGMTIVEGRVYTAGGYQYIGQSGATAIPDLPGLLPFGDMMPWHFGALGTPTDDFAALSAMFAATATLGRTAHLGTGTFLTNSTLSMPNGMTLIGNGDGTSVLKVGPLMSLTATLIGHTTQPVSGVRMASDITLRGITFDGSARAYPVWLSNPSTGAPITDPETDYSSPGILNAVLYPGGINDVVAAGRRNGAAATTQGYILHCNCIDRLTIEDCEFLDHGRHVAYLAGCKDHQVVRNIFRRCGAIDYSSNSIVDTYNGSSRWILSISKANPCVITVDSATAIVSGAKFKLGGVSGMTELPDGVYTATTVSGSTITLANEAGTPIDSTGFSTFVFNGRAYTATEFFIPSENALIADNRFFDLKRAAIQTSGWGGTIRGNIVKGCMECGLYFVRPLDTIVENNEVSDVRMADIVASAVECGTATGLVFRNNVFRRMDECGINGIGLHAVTISNNRIFRPYHTLGIVRPYAPFGERYGYSSPPAIAGIAMDPTAAVGIRLATYLNFPTNGQVTYNVIEDDRTVPFNDSAIFLQRIGGTAVQSMNMLIEGNDCSTYPVADPALMIDTTGNPIVTQTVITRGNKGHTSQSAFFQKVQTFAAATTGVVAIDCGFTPSAYEIIVLRTATALPLNAGFFSGHRTLAAQTGADASAGAGYALGWSATDGESASYATASGRLVNDAGVVQWAASFNSWTNTGLTINVTTATQAANCIIRLFP